MSNTVKTAVIMAAGLGSRFGDKTKDRPKGLIDFNGIPMVKRSIEILLKNDIEKIIIGTGYKSEMYDKYASLYPEVECSYSKEYATTNSMWTLWNCREQIKDDSFLLLESDLIFDNKAIQSLLESPKENILLCSDVIKFQDSYFIEYDKENKLSNCSIDDSELNAKGELVGIHKISNTFYNEMCSNFSSVKNEQPNLGYEFVLLNLAKNKNPIDVLHLSDLKWYEIDDDLDLEFAEKNIIGL